MIQHILFATDLGGYTSYALAYVESLVEQYQARVSVVHAVPPIEELTKAVINSYCSDDVKRELLEISDVSGINELMRDQIFDLLAADSNQLNEINKTSKTYEVNTNASSLLNSLSDIVIRTGNPVEVILNQAQRLKCDLIVIGSHSPNAVDGHLMGSIASKVLQLSKVPVLMIPMLNQSNLLTETKTFEASRFR